MLVSITYCSVNSQKYEKVEKNIFKLCMFILFANDFQVEVSWKRFFHYAAKVWSVAKPYVCWIVNKAVRDISRLMGLLYIGWFLIVSSFKKYWFDTHDCVFVFFFSSSTDSIHMTSFSLLCSIVIRNKAELNLTFNQRKFIQFPFSSPLFFWYKGIANCDVFMSSFQKIHFL